MINYILAFVITVLVELGVAFLIGIKDKSDLWILFFMNLLTNPAANYLFRVYSVFWGDSNPYIAIAAIELIVVMIEMIVIRYAFEWSYKRSIGFSILLNLASYLTGFIIFSL